MLSIVSALSGSSKRALVLISLIIVVTIVDSQFVNAFYGTSLGSPGNLHVLLFISFTIVASVINIILLLFVKRNELQSKTTRSLLFRVAYIGTSSVQYSILVVLLVI